MGNLFRKKDVIPNASIKHHAMIPSTTPWFRVVMIVIKASTGETPDSKKPWKHQIKWMEKQYDDECIPDEFMIF